MINGSSGVYRRALHQPSDLRSTVPGKQQMLPIVCNLMENAMSIFVEFLALHVRSGRNIWDLYIVHVAVFDGHIDVPAVLFARLISGAIWNY